VVSEEPLLRLDAVIERHISRALDLAGGKIHGPGGAGELLGVNPNTLRYKMRKLGIPHGKNFQRNESTRTTGSNKNLAKTPAPKGRKIQFGTAGE
jgi:hypothetical protein